MEHPIRWWVNHCRLPRLAILAGVTSLAAAISTHPAVRSPAFMSGRVLLAHTIHPSSRAFRDAA